MSELTVMELEQESIEALPARELMSGCGCSCGGNVYQAGLVNINDVNIVVAGLL